MRDAVLLQKDEIDELVLCVLELYKKRRVDGNTPEVAQLTEKMIAFAIRHSLEDELRQVREKHLPTKSTEYMEIEDANSIIIHLLSLRSRSEVGPHDIKTLFHPDILRVAGPRMKSRQYADAVESAFKELNNAVKKKVQSRLPRELDGPQLMQHVFSPDRPILLVEDNLDTRSNKDAQLGYMMMFSGAMSAIRNPKAHENMFISEDDALRKLMFASMLMYKLDASHFAAETH